MAEISDLTDVEIKRMIGNYRERNRTHGGKWPLSALMWEQARRTRSPYEIVPLMKAILRLCRASDDHRVSYADLWREVNGAPLPRGNHWVKPLTAGLAHVGDHCVRRGLPLLSTLVVNDQARMLTDEAAYNIWTYMKDRGEPVGDTPRSYVNAQAERASDVTEAQIDAQPG